MLRVHIMADQTFWKAISEHFVNFSATGENFSFPEMVSSDEIINVARLFRPYIC